MGRKGYIVNQPLDTTMQLYVLMKLQHCTNFILNGFCIWLEIQRSHPIPSHGMGWDGMDSGTTCICVDGTGGHPMGSQCPMGQCDRMDSGTTCICVDGTGGHPDVPWDDGIGWTVGLHVYV